MGSNLVWGTDFETGDLSAWQQGPGTGGVYAPDAVDASVAASPDCAHRGRYGAKLTSNASFATPPVANPGSGLFKTAAFPRAAYYSAWYRISAFHRTLSEWTLLSFNVLAQPDAGIDAGPNSSAWTTELSLILQSLPPDGRLALSLADSRYPYLTSAFPESVPLIPIGQWFQIECYYDGDPSAGELRVWLDGAEIYDVQRPMIASPVLQFMPCSLASDLDPPNAELCLDDVIVSWARVTPLGVFRLENGR